MTHGRWRTGPGRAVAAAGPPLAAAVLGGLASRDARSVYARLDKPGWAPPAGVFGPVWTVLYTGIGVVGARMAARPTPARTWVLHGLQLALNAAWTPAFFAIRDKRLALAVVVALDAAATAETVALARTDRVGAALLGPYLGWLLFATALTATVSDPGAAGRS